METRRLYYENSKLRQFMGKVLSCQAGPTGWNVILDETAFYPQGGGQSWDLGTLGEANVLAVTEEKGIITHLCGKPLEVGASVSGEIDWLRRRNHCQKHSGEHIFSGLVAKYFGYHNVGFHMGKDAMQIDFDGPLSWADVERLQQEANEAVWADVPLRIFYPTAEELAALPYRSKKALTGRIRLVEIPGYDLCACCGTHVERTGEIGPIQVLSLVKFHGGVRLELTCGAQAYAYLNRVFRENRGVSQALSAKPLETEAAARRLLAQTEELKYRLVGLENENIQYQAEALGGLGDVILFRKGLAPDSLRRLALEGSRSSGGLCAVFSREGEGYRYAIAGSQDARPVTLALNQAFGGRGGGKPGITQGSVTATEESIRAFWESR